MYGLGAIYTKSKPLPSSQFNGIYKMEEPEFLSVDENRIIIHNYLPFCDRAPSRNLLAPRSRYLDRSITVKHKWIDSTTLHILNRYNEIAMVLNFRHSETGPYFAGTKLYPPRGEFFERFPVYFEEKNRMIFGIVSSNPKDQNTVLVEGGLNSSEGLFAFNLAADETIVSIKVTYNSHRTCIQNLCFETSEGKKYGMFGGPSATPTAELFAAPKAESLKYFGGYVNGLLKSLVVHSTCPWDRRRDLLLLQASLGNLHGTPERGMQKVFREGLLFSTIVLYL